MALFAEQDDFCLALDASEEDLVNMAIQNSLEIDEEKKKQIEMSRAALMMQQDEEYRESLLKDSKENYDSIFDADELPESENESEGKSGNESENENESESEGRNKTLSLPDLRKARMNYFNKQ